MNVHVANIFWRLLQIPAFCLLASKLRISSSSPLQGRRVNRLPCFSSIHPTSTWHGRFIEAGAFHNARAEALINQLTTSVLATLQVFANTWHHGDTMRTPWGHHGDTTDSMDTIHVPILLTKAPKNCTLYSRANAWLERPGPLEVHSPDLSVPGSRWKGDTQGHPTKKGLVFLNS